MVPLGWRISAWVCAGGIQLANIGVTWSLSLRVRCQYYCVGGQPIISAQHFNVEFLQCTEGSWCPLECWWQFNTDRVSTLKGGDTYWDLGELPRPRSMIYELCHGKATVNLRISDVVLVSCSQPASPRGETKLCLLWPQIQRGGLCEEGLNQWDLVTPCNSQTSFGYLGYMGHTQTVPSAGSLLLFCMAEGLVSQV